MNNKIPSSRLPKSIGFLARGSGAWLENAFNSIRVDGAGVPYMAPNTPLKDWHEAFGSMYHNPTVGWVEKLLNDTYKVTVYFLSTEPEQKALVYPRLDTNTVVGRDAFIPFGEYVEYSTNGAKLEFTTPGGPPVPPTPKDKVASGGSEYKSRFP